MTNNTINKIEEICRGFGLETNIERCLKKEGSFGTVFTPSQNGDHLMVTIWLDRDNDTIYREFILSPTRELYRYESSDRETTYFKPDGFYGFTAREKLLIMNIMNYVEEV